MSCADAPIVFGNGVTARRSRGPWQFEFDRERPAVVLSHDSEPAQVASFQVPELVFEIVTDLSVGPIGHGIG